MEINLSKNNITDFQRYKNDSFSYVDLKASVTIAPVSRTITAGLTVPLVPIARLSSMGSTQEVTVGGFAKLNGSDPNRLSLYQERDVSRLTIPPSLFDVWLCSTSISKANLLQGYLQSESNLTTVMDRDLTIRAKACNCECIYTL